MAYTSNYSRQLRTIILLLKTKFKVMGNVYPNNLKNRNLSKATPDHETQRSSPGCILGDGDAFHDQDGADEEPDSSSCLGIESIVP